MDDLAYRIQIAFQLLKQNIESDSLDRTNSEITRPQMFMLYFIHKYGKCKLTQLAEKMEVKPSAITVMIDRLEKAGYVERTHCTEDRRSILVEVTPLGKETLETAIQARSEVIKTYLQRLKPEERITFTELLEALAGLEKKSS